MNWIASLLFVAIPGLLLWLQGRIAIVQKLSPAFWAYVLGILLGTFLPLDKRWGNTLLEMYVALAIPLLLFSANIGQWLRLAPRTLLAYGLYVVAVFLSVGANVWLWVDKMPDVPLRGAMATGVYTGGTANMAAIHVALGGPPSLFAELNFTDLVLSGSLLLLLLSVLPGWLRSFLPPYQGAGEPQFAPDVAASAVRLSLGKKILSIGVSILGAAIVLGLSVGLSYLFWGEGNGTFIVIGLTVLGLLASLIPVVRSWPMSFETGDYLFMAFCVAAGAQIDLMVLWENDWSQAGFMLTTFLGILGLFSLVAWLLRLDADTTLICLTAGIFGPPFIGPVARTLNNREIVIAGMTLGVIGLAIGNFAGLLLYGWLG